MYQQLTHGRTLSAFKPLNRLWAPVSSSRWTPSQVTHRFADAQPSRLSLVTQNLDAFSPRPIARAKLLLDGILAEESNRPDIIFLQEVTLDVHSAILADPRVREAFLVTDAEDQTSFEGVPFANMTLLSIKRFAFDLASQEEDDTGMVEREEERKKNNKFMLGPVSRIKLPSKYGRCAISVDIIIPLSTSSTTSTSTYRLLNVHLDSLGHTLRYRTQQLEILANLLREPGYAGGLIAGDFNAISVDDHALLDKDGLVDAWIALYGEEGPDGATWGVGVERDDGLRAGRLDKVAMLGGVEANDMEILRPRLIEVPKPAEGSDYIPCSDHYGLRLGFTV